jgi:hypothetical protein
MNMNNLHDANRAFNVLGRASPLRREVSDYHLNGGEKNVMEKTPEELSDMCQPSKSSEINCSHNEQMPKMLLKKMKKKKKQNSKPARKWFKGRTDIDKLKHQKSSAVVSERENYDDECPVSFQIQPISCGESVLNSSILEEVLSEKKRVSILMRSHSYIDHIKLSLSPLLSLSLSLFLFRMWEGRNVS